MGVSVNSEGGVSRWFRRSHWMVGEESMDGGEE